MAKSGTNVSKPRPLSELSLDKLQTMLQNLESEHASLETALGVKGSSDQAIKRMKWRKLIIKDEMVRVKATLDGRRESKAA